MTTHNTDSSGFIQDIIIKDDRHAGHGKHTHILERLVRSLHHSPKSFAPKLSSKELSNREKELSDLLLRFRVRR